MSQLPSTRNIRFSTGFPCVQRADEAGNWTNLPPQSLISVWNDLAEIRPSKNCGRERGGGQDRESGERDQGGGEAAVGGSGFSLTFSNASASRPVKSIGRLSFRRRRTCNKLIVMKMPFQVIGKATTLFPTMGARTQKLNKRLQPPAKADMEWRYRRSLPMSDVSRMSWGNWEKYIFSCWRNAGLRSMEGILRGMNCKKSVRVCCWVRIVA